MTMLQLNRQLRFLGTAVCLLALAWVVLHPQWEIVLTGGQVAHPSAWLWDEPDTRLLSVRSTGIDWLAVLGQAVLATFGAWFFWRVGGLPRRRGVPDRIPIVHDDHHASRIGRLADGRQFFVTEPFVAADSDEPGCDFLAVYLFAADGTLEEARIDSLGPRESIDDERARALVERRLAELGEVSFESIAVKPFHVVRDGVTFGLVPQEPECEGEGDDWWVVLVPGDYMAFTAPWDGYYDT